MASAPWPRSIRIFALSSINSGASGAFAQHETSTIRQATVARHDLTVKALNVFIVGISQEQSELVTGLLIHRIPASGQEDFKAVADFAK